MCMLIVPAVTCALCSVCLPLNEYGYLDLCYSLSMPTPVPVAGLGFLASNVDVISTMIEHLCKQAVSEFFTEWTTYSFI